MTREETMKETKKVTLRLPEETHEELLKLSEKFGLGINSLVIVALLKHLGEI